MYNLMGLSKARQVHCRSRDRNNTLEIITRQYICYNDYTQEMFCLCNIFGQMSNIVMFIIIFFFKIDEVHTSIILSLCLKKSD